MLHQHEVPCAIPLMLAALAFEQAIGHPKAATHAEQLGFGITLRLIRTDDLHHQVGTRPVCILPARVGTIQQQQIWPRNLPGRIRTRSGA